MVDDGVVHDPPDGPWSKLDKVEIRGANLLMEDGVDPHEEFLGEGTGDHVLNIVAHVKRLAFSRV